MNPEALLTLLKARRFTLAREKQTQAEIEAVLTAAGVAFKREVDIGRRDIIDFLVGGDIGIEVKVGGSKRDIFAQCKRYCETNRLTALILATNVATGFPAELAGRPCFVLSLGRAWL